jgi:hypothetical protein
VDTNEKLKTVQQRILAGDESAVPEFRKLLRANPNLVDSWARKPVAALLARISGMMTNVAKGAPLLFTEGLTITMDSIRSSLAGPAPSPVEKLLVERIVACWLQVYSADLEAAGCVECSFAEGTYRQQRQDRANRRFFSACRTLATVRRLALPIKVDVNLAGTVKTENTAPARFALPTGMN